MVHAPSTPRESAIRSLAGPPSGPQGPGPSQVDRTSSRDNSLGGQSGLWPPSFRLPRGSASPLRWPPVGALHCVAPRSCSPSGGTASGNSGSRLHDSTSGLCPPFYGSISGGGSSTLRPRPALYCAQGTNASGLAVLVVSVLPAGPTPAGPSARASATPTTRQALPHVHARQCPRVRLPPHVHSSNATKSKRVNDAKEPR